MATDAELDYLRRQYAKRNFNQAMGYQPVNQGDMNEAEMTPWVSFTQEEQGTAPMNYQTEPQEEEHWWDGLETAAGKVEDFMWAGTKGFLGFFEGIGDLVLTGVSALGDATGWYDTQGIKDFTAQDVSGELTSTLKSSGLFMPGQFVKNLTQGKFADRQFWQDLGSGLSASFDPNQEASDFTSQYDLNGKVETDTGKFAQGVFESIGRMLPSIGLGSYLGASGTVGEKGAKFLSTSLMGASAGGSSASEALNEGASSGQALAYGVASGFIEAGTEYIPFKGGNKLAGMNLTKSAVTKATIGSFLKEAVEEGLEEVASGVTEPALKAIYKGTGEFEAYKPENWGEGIANLSKEFLAGFVSGGIMSGGQMVSDIYQAGGVTKYNDLQRLKMSVSMQGQLYDDWLNGKLSGNQTLAKMQETANQTKSIAEELNQKYGKEWFNEVALDKKGLSEKQFNERQKYIQELTDAKSYTEFLEDFYDSNIQDFITEMGTSGKAIFNGFLQNQLRAQTGNQNLIAIVGSEQQFSKDTQAVHIGVNDNGQLESVIINPKYADKMAGLLGHEVLVHALLDNDVAVRQKLIDYFLKNDNAEFTKNDEKIRKAYSNNGTSPSDEVFQSERLANYIERKMSTPKGVMQLVSGRVGLLNIIKTAFTKGLGLKNVRMQMAIANAIRALEAGQEAQRSGALAYSKELSVSPSEQENANEVKASKNLEYSDKHDSEGEILSKGQVEFFEDSKVRDKDGNLMVVYHGTLSEQFSVFDNEKSLNHKDLINTFGANVNFFTNNKSVATEYSRNLQQKGDVLELYLNIEKPFVLNGKGNLGARIQNKEVSNIRKTAVDYIKSKWLGKSINENDISEYNKDLAVLDISVEKQDSGYYNLIQHEYVAGPKGDYVLEYYLSLDELTSDEYGLAFANDFDLEETLSTNQIVKAVLWSNEHLNTAYDGVIFENIKDGMAGNASEESTVYATFNANQIKNTSNQAPTSNDDIRYSKNLDQEERKINELALEGYQNTVDYYQEELELTKQEAYEVQSALKQQFKEEAKNLRKYTPLAQKLLMAHINANNISDGLFDVPTDAESIAMNAERLSMLPFAQGGVMSDGKLQLKTFVPALEKLSEIYDSDNFKDLYNPALALAMKDMVDSWEAKGSATPEQEQQALELYKSLRKLGGKNMRRVELQRIEQAAETDYGFSALGIYNDSSPVKTFTKKLLSIISDPRASIDMFLSELTFAGDKLINEGSKQAGFARAYMHDGDIKIAQIQKELGIDKKMPDVVVNGVSMPFLAALEWDLMLSMPEGSKELANAKIGYSFDNRKTGKEVIVKFNDSVQEQLDKAISKEKLKKAHELIVDDYYGKFNYDKIEQVYKDRTGLKNFGELFPRGDYMRLATRQTRTSLLTPHVEGVPSISNLMKRSKGAGPIKMGGGLFAKMRETTRMTAYESFLQPLVTELNNVLNTLDKDGINLISKTSKEKQQFVKWYISALTGGIHPEATGGFGQAMTTMVLSNFKIGPIQTLSAFTSGLNPNEQFRPQIMKEALKPSDKYQKALENLFEVVPEAKYRGDGNDVYFGNVGDTRDSMFSNAMKAIGQTVSKLTGTNFFDKATVRYILLSAMQTQANAMNKSIDDMEVAKAVESRARDIYMTQISNNSAHFSPAQFVDNPYGKTTGGQRTAMRIAKAFGGAAKAFTNFFNRTVIRLGRMYTLGKWLEGQNIETYEQAIESADKTLNDLNARRKEVEAEYEKAKDERIKNTDLPMKEMKGDKAFDKLVERQKNLRKEIKKAKDKKLAAKLSERLDSVTNEIKEKLKEPYKKAKEKETALKAELKALDDSIHKAENALAEAKGHKTFYEKSKKAYDVWHKDRKAVKSIAAMLAGLLLAGLGKTAIDALYNLLFNRKDLEEIKSDAPLEIVLNSTVNLYPGLRTIAGVFQGYETTDPTMRTFKMLTDTMQSVQKFSENQSEGNAKAMMRNGLQVFSLVSGIPFKTVYDQFTGFVSHFSPEVALKSKNIFYQVSSTLNGELNNAVENGDSAKASAYVGSIANDRVGQISSQAQAEITRLAMAGESATPSALPTSYTDEDGNAITLTWTQQQEAKRYYSKANSQVNELISSTAYSRLTDTEKAYAVKAVYTAYRAASIAKAVGASYKGTLNRSALLAKSSSGKVSTIIAAVSHIRSLQATKSKTKKQLAIEYVNRIAGLTKQERLIALKMAGYSVDTASVSSYLRSKGLSKDEAEWFAS